jgi:ribonuclease D
VDWIETDAALAELCTHLREQPFVAVDTEFHRERTYYAHLALVQVASSERVACIDPLSGIDLAPLDALMLDDSVLKVVHAGRQDLEVFFDRTGRIPAPVFDTQIAASLLGRGDQIGYAALVSQVTGHKLDKLHGRTDWMRRPLEPAVIEYAAADVVHLREVYATLRDELEALGRRPWLDEEQAHLLVVETYRIDEDDAWKRIKSVGRLKGVECAVAQRLAGWREARARKIDRPRKRVLTDEAILDLARQRPTEVSAMERMRSIDDGVRRKHGQELVERIQAAARSPRDEWPAPLDRGPGAPFDSALADALAAVVQARARAANITARMLSSKGDLERLASGETDLPVLAGWRAELAGDALRAFLNGALRLEVKDGALQLVDVPPDDGSDPQA